MKDALKILLIDDEVDRIAAKDALTSACVSVTFSEASGVDEALMILGERRIDCALVDCRLPDGDGLELIHRARESGNTTPFVVLTGEGDEQIAVELMKAGASDYLTRDRVSPESLLRSIQTAVRIHRAEEVAARANCSMRESEARFRTMADSAPVLLWVADADRSYSYFNKVWLDFTGRAMNQELGSGWTDGIHPEDRQRHSETFEAGFDRRVAFEMEYRLRRHDGEYRWIMDRGTPRIAPDGAFVGFIGFCIDLTERRQAEEELKRSQTDIEALNERLKRAMTETHHRVKNNLQIIAAMVDMKTMDPNRTITTAELKDFGMHIHMLAVVHDVLTQEAKKDGQAAYVSAEAVLGRLLPILRQMAADKRVEFEIEDARLSAKQGSSLAIVLNELVSNAVKYGSTEIVVSLRIQGGTAVLEVCDDGPGFPPDFDPRTSASTGLELVESLSRWDLGGEVEYGNRPDGGALVTVRIPLPEDI